MREKHTAFQGLSWLSLPLHCRCSSSGSHMNPPCASVLTLAVIPPLETPSNVTLRQQQNLLNRPTRHPNTRAIWIVRRVAPSRMQSSHKDTISCQTTDLEGVPLASHAASAIASFCIQPAANALEAWSLRPAELVKVASSEGMAALALQCSTQKLQTGFEKCASSTSFRLSQTTFTHALRHSWVETLVSMLAVAPCLKQRFCRRC